MTKYFISLLMTLAALLFDVSIANAAVKEISLTHKIPIAIIEFDSSDWLPISSREFTNIILNDVEKSGEFKSIKAPKSQEYLYKDKEVDYNAWSKAGQNIWL